MKYLLLFLALVFPLQSYALDREVLVDEINQVRAEQGVQAVTLDPLLNVIALEKAFNMKKQNYWAHNNNGNTWSFFDKYNYQYHSAGEIIVKDALSESIAVQAWLGSPSHKAVINNPIYTRTGVGTIGNITVQIFAFPLKMHSTTLQAEFDLL